MKKLKSILALVLSLVMSISCAVAESAPLRYTKGDKILDFTITTYDDGENITLSEVLKEKDAVFINIWATWCGPCRNEFPFLEEAYEQYKDNIEVFALSCEPTDDAAKLASFAQDNGLTFKIGQDPVGFLSAFGVNSIPTSFVVDRFGTICFIESGAQPDVGSFTRLFDAFIGPDYTESVLLDGIPAQKPTVAYSSEEDLSAALEAAATNPTGSYTWPMIAAEIDGRSVVTSSNAGYNTSKSSVTVTVSARKGNAIIVTFKTSTEAACDLLKISVNGKVVKVFGGLHDWMTYAIPVDQDGTYSLTLSYVKDNLSAAGEDTVWIDRVAVLSGDEAENALLANPAYPVAKENGLLVTNPAAKEILISDETGILYANFGSAKYYIINENIASFAANLSEESDPESAFFYCNYDGRITPVTAGMTAENYTVTSGVDSYETTGYNFACMYLYSDTNASDVKTVVFFKDETNTNMFVNGNKLGTWTYAESSAEPPKNENVEATYTIKCIDQDGNPVPGALVQVCNEETCQVFVSDQNGLYDYTAAAYAWEIHILKAPEGYSAVSTDTVLAPIEGGEIVFAFTKK